MSYRIDAASCERYRASARERKLCQKKGKGNMGRAREKLLEKLERDYNAGYKAAIAGEPCDKGHSGAYKAGHDVGSRMFPRTECPMCLWLETSNETPQPTCETNCTCICHKDN